MPKTLRWATLFLFSGCAGLIFEVLWTRQAGLVLGGTVQAAATVAAAFMGGLGAGAQLAGRWAPRFSRPLLAFACLEALVAGLGTAVTAVFPLLPTLLQGSGGLVRTLAVIFLLLWPTLAMGATLPVLVEGFASARGQFQSVLTLFYGLNTLGAAAGAYLTDAALIPRLGVWQSGLCAASLDLSVAVLALLGSHRRTPPLPREEESHDEDPTARRAVFALFASSFAGLVLQVSWTRMLVFVNGSDAQAYSMVLVVYLLGLGLGGLVVSRLGQRNLARSLAFVLAVVGFTGYAGLLLVAPVAALADSLRLAYESPLRPLLTSLLCIFPCALGLGLVFPLASLWLHQGSRSPSSTVASAYLFSIAGSVLGALSCGSLWLPVLGLQGSILLASLCALMTAAWLGRWPVLLLSLALLATPRDYLILRLSRTPAQDILYHGEDSHGSVYLIRDRASGVETETLMVDGFNMAGNDMAARRYTTMLTLIPALSHPAPRSVLVICLGMANTCSAALHLAGVEQVECVELSQKVVAALQEREMGRALLANPKLRLTLDDGRHHLLTTDRRYDLITAEPPPPRHAGVVNLYSKEYYQLCKRALNPGGVVAQWLPVFELTDVDARTIMRAFQEVFPYCHLWQGDRLQLVLVGSLSPIEYDYGSIRKVVTANQEWLRPLALGHPELIAASWMAGPKQLSESLQSTPPLTDDQPYIQYLTPGENLSPDSAWFFSPRPLPFKVQADLREELLGGRLARLREWAYCYARLGSLDRWVLGRRLLDAYPGDPYFELITLSGPGWELAASGLALARIHYLHGRSAQAAQELGKLADGPEKQLLLALVDGKPAAMRAVLARPDLSPEQRAFSERWLGQSPAVFP